MENERKKVAKQPGEPSHAEAERELYADFDDWLALANEFLSSGELEQPTQKEKTLITPSRDTAVNPSPQNMVKGNVVQPEKHIPTEPPHRSDHQPQKHTKLALSTKEAVPVVLNLKSSRLSNSTNPSVKSDLSSSGIRTQINPKSAERDDSHLIIGIDFGTSSTKVVVRDWMMNQAYAVPFQDYAPQENCYLLPTTIFLGHDGILRLDAGDIFVSELKRRFINSPSTPLIQVQDPNDPFSLNVQELLVGYLALALREIRGWFFSYTGKQYENKGIQWYANIGVPSETYDDIRLRQRFEHILQIAWYASAQKREIDLGLIKESFQEINSTNSKMERGNTVILDDARLHPSYFSTHPEVIMEVVGYAKSPLGQRGTHMLIDVGASTLDVATFRVSQRDEEDLYAILSCKVAWFGSTMLHKKRIEDIKGKIRTAFLQINERDPTRPLLSVGGYQIGISKVDIEKVDEDFGKSCRKVIGEVVRETREKRDPNSEAWQGVLPVFVCGGGMKEKIYQDVVDGLSSSLANAFSSFQGFKVLKIPKPRTLEAPHIVPDEYSRLAVAYGLSFSSDEIGDIRSKKNVTNQLRDKQLKDHADRYVGAEQV